MVMALVRTALSRCWLPYLKLKWNRMRKIVSSVCCIFYAPLFRNIFTWKVNECAYLCVAMALTMAMAARKWWLFFVYSKFIYAYTFALFGFYSIFRFDECALHFTIYSCSNISLQPFEMRNPSSVSFNWMRVCVCACVCAYCSAILMWMTHAYTNNEEKKMKDVIRTDSFDCVSILTEWHNANENWMEFEGDAKDEDINAWRFIYHSHPHECIYLHNAHVRIISSNLSVHTLSINLILSLQER